jgi:hypothetical protein
MKKLFIIGVLAILGMQICQAQSFKKRDNFLEVSYGFTYYPELENNIRLYGINATFRDDAASNTLGVQFERAVSNYFGLGLRVSSQNFRDSADVSSVDASTLDVAAVLNFHIVRTKGLDLYASALFGGSTLKIEDNRSDLEYDGNGTYTELGVGLRYFFGGSIYLSGQVSFPKYKIEGDYTNFVNNKVEGSWDATGTKFAIGLGVRL